ncbi:hypothetical protein [Bizionia myxarmorum]|uniref:Uncharacterized protein n=1 Tax=Bizionia myxarmorum TaxID=291186 RepID=A0A5D0REW7_9FLAO|nr:hypothetical protein [Bizionia myxarmorum]TYB79481.1 hypothetical protein ES674_06895 [Bizionia myxarmorum]
MKSNIEETRQKCVLLKSFPKFQQIENVIDRICHTNNDGIQISVLGKLEGINLDTHPAVSWNELKNHCEDELILTSNSGMVSNPEIGAFFIVGFLAPIFLQEINGKKIGSMSTGLYGILRGLGIDQDRVTACSKSLSSGNYLLIVRGSRDEIMKLEDNIKELD